MTEATLFKTMRELEGIIRLLTPPLRRSHRANPVRPVYLKSSYKVLSPRYNWKGLSLKISCMLVTILQMCPGSGLEATNRYKTPGLHDEASSVTC